MVDMVDLFEIDVWARNIQLYVLLFHFLGGGFRNVYTVFRVQFTWKIVVYVRTTINNMYKAHSQMRDIHVELE